MMQPTPGVAPPPPVAAPVIDPQQQQQQWMMMQPQMQPQPQPQPPPQAGFWAPQHQPQAQPQHPQQQLMAQQYPQQPTSADDIRTLWVGDLQFWMDEAYLHNCFGNTQEVVSVKIIRNKQTGQSEGYGFVEFASHGGAERFLQNYNGTQMPNSDQFYRMNWATFGIGEKRPEVGPDYPIFVGDLSSDVTDYLLQETFRSRYQTVKGAKVVTDRVTGRSKGYGFVRFGDENEQVRAMTEMNGVFCSSRPMRIGPATTKKTTGFQQPYPKGCQEALFRYGPETKFSTEKASF